MEQTTKINKSRTLGFLKTYLNGKLLSTGTGKDVASLHSQGFDLLGVDTNRQEQYFKFGSSDYVYSSQSSGHMYDSANQLIALWAIVRSHGYLTTPLTDGNLHKERECENLMNSDHKSTFHLDKHHSWPSVSNYTKQLGPAPPSGQIVNIQLQTNDYYSSFKFPKGINKKSKMHLLLKNFLL